MTRSAAAESYRAWYFTKRWRALRKQQLQRQPLCERCLSRGILTPARVAYHRTPHRGDAVLFFDAGNIASSCKPCHDIDENRIEHGAQPRRGCGADGWPI